MPSSRGVSSSLLQVIVLIRVICSTICTRSLIAVPSGTWDLFRSFNNASWCASDDNNRGNVEIYTGCFLNCSTTEYLLLLRVLINSAVSFSLSWFFLCGSLARVSFTFIFLSSASFRSFGWYTRPFQVNPLIFKTCLAPLLPYDQNWFCSWLRCRVDSESGHI